MESFEFSDRVRIDTHRREAVALFEDKDVAAPTGLLVLQQKAQEPGILVRADALLSWCRGFLGGFGLAAGAKPPLSEESEEALGDIARIAASDLSYEDPEADAAALEEVSEFIRVAVMLLHSDCVLGPRHRRKLN